VPHAANSMRHRERGAAARGRARHVHIALDVREAGRGARAVARRQVRQRLQRVLAVRAWRARAAERGRPRAWQQPSPQSRAGANHASIWRNPAQARSACALASGQVRGRRQRHTSVSVSGAQAAHAQGPLFAPTGPVRLVQSGEPAVRRSAGRSARGRAPAYPCAPRRWPVLGTASGWRSSCRHVAAAQAAAAAPSARPAPQRAAASASSAAHTLAAQADLPRARRAVARSAGQGRGRGQVSTGERATRVSSSPR
jgi:hypothetical protein